MNSLTVSTVTFWSWRLLREVKPRTLLREKETGLLLQFIPCTHTNYSKSERKRKR